MRTVIIVTKLLSANVTKLAGDRAESKQSAKI